MSIEQQLSKAFKHNDSSLQCPPALDAQILADYEQAVLGKGRNDRMKKKASLPKIAVIALIVAVLCGFAYGSKFLFSDSTGFLSYEFYSSEDYDLKQDTLEKTRAALKEVRSQLAPGETAIVYLPEAIKGYPIFGVTNPDYIYDSQNWQAVLEEKGVTEKLPNSLLEGTYGFEAGTLNNPFHPVIGMDQIELIEEMEAEHKTAEKDYLIWRITDPATMPSISSYTSIYRDESGEKINLTWEVYTQSVYKKEGFTSPRTEYEEYTINGKKVHYTKNTQSLFTESGVLHNVMWMGEKDGKTTIYSLESDSLAMTKETLIEAVSSLP